MTTCWWLIRHAEVLEAKGRITGQSDLDADVRGLSPHPSLPSSPKAVVVSPLCRTRQTAIALGYRPTHTEPDLAEQHFGDWQGKSWDEITGPEGRAFWTDFAKAVPPGGESFEQLTLRVAPTIDRLSNEIGDGDILAVLHGGTIRAALAHALGLDPMKVSAFVVDNLSLTQLERTPYGWRIGCVNERLWP